MIKLVAVEFVQERQLRLRFSDGTWGVLDLAPLLSTSTAMTAPLREESFFRRCFLELGALAWPNGFDLSAASLRGRLEKEGLLRRASEAA